MLGAGRTSTGLAEQGLDVVLGWLRGRPTRGPETVAKTLDDRWSSAVSAARNAAVALSFAKIVAHATIIV